MKRTEIIEEAKLLVLDHGPNNVLEFGVELLERSTGWGDPRREHADAIIREARRQAVRVCRFLGYEPAAMFANALARPSDDAR
jgi:hypothetical protein